MYSIENMVSTPEKTPSPPRFYTVNDLAHETGLSVFGIYRFVNQGLIKAVRFGRAYRIPADEYERVLREGVAKESA